MNVKGIVASVFSVAIKIVVLIIAIMFIYKYAAMAYDYGYRIFSEGPVSTGEGREVSVTITSDMDSEAIGEALENKGLIRDAKLFVLQERLSEYHGKIQPGTYTLSTAMVAEEMIAVMSANAPEKTEEEEEFDPGFGSMSGDDMMDFEDEIPMEEAPEIEGYAPVEEGNE